MKKELQVDRFEGNIAVLIGEDKSIYDVDKEIFGFELHEGDLLEAEMENDTPVSAVFLAEKTAALREEIRVLMAKLRRKK